MALCGPSTVRVRVLFDYPPPALPDCRMCWVLVDLNRCRVVADLASVIRDKLEFSRRTVLNLFMEDCYLPPAESAHVVRDNDTIRVKVDLLPQDNGWASAGESDTGALRSKKRGREPEEEPMAVKKKRRRKKSKKRQVEDVEEQAETTKKKKQQKQRKRSTEQAAVPKKPPCLEKDTSALGSVPIRRALAHKRVSSSSETSSSEEEPPKKSVLRPGGTASAPGKEAKPARPTARPAAPHTSDCSSDSSDTAAPQEGKVPQTFPKDPSAAAGSSSAAPAPAPGPGPAAAEVKGRGERAETSSSDSSSETELVIKRPDPAAALLRGSGRGAQLPRGVGRGSIAAAGRGAGRGNIWPPQNGGGGRGMGSRGVGRGGPLHNGPRFPSQNGQRQQQQDEILTNRTVVLQNPPASAPRRDYAALPLLAAPPAVGQKIAFKLLELTENYTPEVSDYKEGKIIGFDQTNNQVELELLSSAPAPTEPGKFDLVYQAPDGSEVVEYAVCRGSQLKERWESLLEPRLLVENMT